MAEYRVPNMTLVRQDMNNACWWASASMLLMWRNRFRDPFQMDHPAYHQDLRQTHRANNGLPWASMVRFARELGLIPIPPLRGAPTVSVLMDLLRRFGPLWADGAPLNSTGNFAGIGHVVVIAGARTTPATEILIYDPWPPNQGGIYWRSADLLPLMFIRQIGNPASPVSILHLPETPR